MTNIQIKNRILQDLNQHAKILIRKTFISKQNKNIHDNKLSGIIGWTASKDTTKIQVDTDGDGIKDKEWTLKTDGTYVETNLP